MKEKSRDSGMFFLLDVVVEKDFKVQVVFILFNFLMVFIQIFLNAYRDLVLLNVFFVKKIFISGFVIFFFDYVFMDFIIY